MRGIKGVRLNDWAAVRKMGHVGLRLCSGVAGLPKCKKYEESIDAYEGKIVISIEK